MFICNLKINGNIIFKTIMCILLIIVLIICGFIINKLITSSKNLDNQTMNITTANYTNILKTVHDDLSNYIGQKIKFSGYMYRVYDFKDTQFVLARNMIISSDFQSVIVGFLCDYKDAKMYKDDSWVEIEGKITRGEYHGEMPIIEVTSIKQIEKPTDEYVYPPDENYLATSSLVFE